MRKADIKRFETWLSQIDKDAKLTAREKVEIFERFKDESSVYLLKWMMALEGVKNKQLPSSMPKLLESGKLDELEDIIVR